jgi:pimeloyl-ACP methyl ester carboxylesterase/ribosomal protein S18 acetylase RimI-like enzyme
MKPVAQRLPNVSPAILSRLKLLLRVLQALSPRLASGLAFRLFLKPARRELLETDAAFMASAKVRQLQVGDDRVQVYEWGTGARTVLIAHGWGSRAARFAPLASALATRGWRVLAFDAPGHGLSPGTSSSLPQFMAALDAIAMQLGPVQAVIGHSLGALAIACQRASAPPWAGALQKVVLVSMPAGAAFLVASFQQMFGIGAATARELLARFRQRFATTPEFFSASPDAAPLQHATLLVHDRHDDIVPFAHSEQLLPRLKAGTLLATESLGHSALTRDAATIQAIGAFLDAGADVATTQVRRADLQDDADGAAIVRLLDAYAADPRGGGTALPAAVQARLVAGLRATPTARVWLAFEGAEATGVCVGFVGYSTFQARPLLNIHDLAVLPGRRGRGTGRALLAAAEAQALAEGCCKLTLEVQDDNTPARQLYDRFGFRDVRYGDSGPTRFLGKTL